MKSNFERRKIRSRYKLRSVSKGEKIRLSVFRSSRHIYVQAIDDSKGITLFSASTCCKDFPKDLNSKGIDGASWVGEKLAESMKNSNHSNFLFDRGAYSYRGRVKALGDKVASFLGGAK